MTHFFKRVKRFILPETDSEIKAEIAKMNFRRLLIISLVGGAIEALGLVLLFVSDWDGVNTARSIKSLTFSLLFCVCFQINLRIIRRKYSSDYKVIGFETLLLFATMTAWGVTVSYDHYIKATQMLTFYAVIVCLVSMLVIRPAYSIVLVALSFGVLYFMAFRFDGAKSINVFNYSSIMLLCIVGSLSKYKTTIDVLHSRAEVTALNEKLRLAARTDIMAGIQNRYALAGDYPEYIGRDILLCVCDVDSFKFFNDKYGHAAGDVIIKEIAAILTDEFGASNVYRYGGDEFVIISQAGHAGFGEKLTGVKSALGQISIDGIDEPIACSFGTAQSAVDSREDLDRLLREADSRMYAEKNAKR